MNWYIMGLKKYATFSGRSRRKEYWYFFLFNIIINAFLSYIDTLSGSFNYETGYGLFSGVYTLALIIPGLAVTVRRLHDTGRTGWWLLIGFVPIVGLIALLYFFCSDGETGSNEFGGDPKAHNA